MIVLDPTVRAGSVAIAAVCRVTIDVIPHGRGDGTGIAAWASKTPLAILVAQDRRIRALSPTGEDLPIPELEALAPGAATRFRAHVAQG